MRIKAIALAILAPLWSQSALANAPEWEVRDATGQVHILNGSDRIEASRGATLGPGASVETGAEGRAVLARGSEVVFVSPQTRLTVPTAEQARGLVRIIQDLGRATYMIARKAQSHFAVGTPLLAAVVKGSVFTVAVDSARVSVSVREGQVEVSSPRSGIPQIIATGMTASVTAASSGRIVLRAGPDRDLAGIADPPAAADPTARASRSDTPRLDYVLAFMESDDDRPADSPAEPPPSDLDVGGPETAMSGGAFPEPVIASAIASLIPNLPTAAPQPAPAPRVVAPPVPPEPEPAPIAAE